jgi:hypothetical protein
MIVFGYLSVTNEAGPVIFRTDDGMGFDAIILPAIIKVLSHPFQYVPEQRYRDRAHSVKTLYILFAQVLCAKLPE